jgi:hypothetical protein
MTKLLEEALEEVRTLPEDEQDRVAHALIAFMRERHDYTFGDGQSPGSTTRWRKPTAASSRAAQTCGRFLAARYEGERHA